VAEEASLANFAPGLAIASSTHETLVFEAVPVMTRIGQCCHFFNQVRASSGFPGEMLPSSTMRGERPFVFSNSLKTGQGLDTIAGFIETQGPMKEPWEPSSL
jgi:hypothetical protein